MRVRATPSEILPSAAGKFDSVEFESYKRNLVAMIKSPALVNRALDEKSVQELPIIRQHSADLADWLAEQLEVKFPGGGELMTVSLSAGDKEQAGTIVNAVVAAFMKEFVDKERTDRLAQHDNLDKKYRAYKQQVLDKQRQLHALTREIGAADSQSAKTLAKMETDALDTLMRQRTDIQKQIGDLTLEIEMAKLMAKNAKNAENEVVPEDEIEATIVNDPRIQRTMLELAKLLHDEGEAEKTSKEKPSDPAAVRIRDEINTVRRSIEGRKNEGRLQVIEQIRNQNRTLGAGMLAIKLQWDLLNEQYAQITQLVQQKADAVQKLDAFNGEPDELHAEIEEQKGVIRDMANTLTAWTIELDAPPRTRVVDPAAQAEAVQPARQYILAGIVGLLGFGLTLFGVTIVRFLRRKRRISREWVEAEGIWVAKGKRKSRRWIWLAILFGLFLGGALGAAVWFMFPTKYESAAVLQVRIQPPSVWHAEGGLDVESYKRFAMAQIKGPFVINKALDSKAIQDIPLIQKNKADQVTWLTDELDIDPGTGNLMRVSMRNEDPDGLPDIINAVVTAYLAEVVDRERTDKLEKKELLNRKYLTYKQTALENEHRLYTLQQEVGAGETAQIYLRMARDELETSLNSRTELQKQIFDLSLKIKMATLSAKNAENDVVPEEGIETVLSRDPQIQQNILELSKLLRERGEAEKTATGKVNDPAVDRIRDAIKKLQEKLDTLRNADRQ